MVVTWNVLSVTDDMAVVEYTDGTNTQTAEFEMKDGFKTDGSFDAEFMKFQFINRARNYSKDWGMTPLTQAENDAVLALSGDENDKFPTINDAGSVIAMGPKAVVIE